MFLTQSHSLLPLHHGKNLLQLFYRYLNVPGKKKKKECQAQLTGGLTAPAPVLRTPTEQELAG